MRLARRYVCIISSWPSVHTNSGKRLNYRDCADCYRSDFCWSAEIRSITIGGPKAGTELQIELILLLKHFLSPLGVQAAVSQLPGEVHKVCRIS